jgi:phenylpropionate dioxygenase-like ring-hydroxylating dioxygenase large terminal subunit
MQQIKDTEIIEAAIAGFRQRLADIQLAADICRKRIRGERYVLSTGQLCCPFHGPEYDFTGELPSLQRTDGRSPSPLEEMAAREKRKLR